MKAKTTLTPPALMMFPLSNRYLGIGTTILPFLEVDALTEEPAHLAEYLVSASNKTDSNLGEGFMTGKGWQSRKFCEYP